MSTDSETVTKRTVLVATWRNGLFVVEDGEIRHELAGQPVRSLASDGGGALAIVDGRKLCRRTIDGTWSTVTEWSVELACCVAVGDLIYLGTDDANVIAVRPDGTAERLEGFDRTAGREKWYAGAALVNGKLLGPPLGVRSITATCDHAAILANVHVGGIPRSTDGGATWRPTIDMECDVHQVCAHPERPNIVAAAAGTGLGISRDGGLTWSVEHHGLHASYCSAVAFNGDDILVAASVDHFATQGAIYRRPLNHDGPMVPLGGGFPERIEGITDTGNVATRGATVAIADRGGNLYVSEDGGHSWARAGTGLQTPSCVFIC